MHLDALPSSPLLWNPGPGWLWIDWHLEEMYRVIFLLVGSCLVCSAFHSFELFYF